MSFNENSRVKIPAILHLCRLGYDYLSLSKSTHDEVPDKVQSVVKSNFDDLLASSIKKNREGSSYRNETILSLKRRYSSEKCLQVLQYLKEENINPSELLNLIREVLTTNPFALSTTEKEKQNLKSDIKRAIRIYDWLRYYKNKGALTAAATNCPPCWNPFNLFLITHVSWQARTAYADMAPGCL